MVIKRNQIGCRPTNPPLIKDIDTWIMDLRTYAMKERTSPRSRKATELMVKHRANLTYRSTLTRFGHKPSMETMV